MRTLSKVEMKNKKRRRSATVWIDPCMFVQFDSARIYSNKQLNTDLKAKLVWEQ